MRRGPRIAIGAALLLLMGLFCALRLELSNEITHFLAPGDDPRLAKLSRRLSESELTRTMILSVSADDTATAIEAVDALEAELAEHPEVAWTRTGWNPEHNQAFHELYFPRRLLMLSDRPDEELPKLLSDEGLHGAAREVLRQLSLPTEALVKKLVPADPLLAYLRQLKRLERARKGALSIEDGHFVTEDGHAILLMASVHSPFVSEHQRPLQEFVRARFDAIAAERGGGLKMEQSGVGRFALKAEDQIRGDITRISVLSTVGIIALFLIMFRSARLVLLPVVPIAFGVATATTVSLLLFGRIHGLTLAFGASLIGIAIDYPVHLFNHHLLDPGDGGAEGTLRRIRPGLLLGALTTIAGFAGLGWTSFPGVREIALFASVGIAAALSSTMYLLPALLPDRPAPVPMQRRLADGLRRLIERMRARRAPLLVAPVLALGLCAAGAMNVEFEDDVSALTRLDPELLAEDERVREGVSRMDAGRLVVAIADSEEAALERNDEVFRRLTDAREAGHLEDFRSLHTFLWSDALQSRNRERLQADPQLFERVAEAFEAEGFRNPSVAFADFDQALHDIPEEPLTYEALAESPLRELMSSFRTELDGEVGILTFLRGVSDPEAVAAAVDGIDGVYLFDQKATMADIYGRHRVQALQLVSIGLLAVLLMLLARYRRQGPALAAFLPALLAGGASLAVISLSGTPLHLLHVVSLLLVLSMGVDYGVFLAESRADPDDEAATLLSLVIACASTVFAFGLLAMSSNPALEAIGYTTGLGVCFSLLLAPTTLVLLGKGTSK